MIVTPGNIVAEAMHESDYYEETSHFSSSSESHLAFLSELISPI